METSTWFFNLSTTDDFMLSTTDHNPSEHGLNATLITSKWILLGLAIFSLIFIFLPFSIYYAIKVYQNKHSIIVHKRFPYLILVTVIGNCIYLSTEKTLMLLLSFEVITSSNKQTEETIEFIIYASIHWVFIYALYLTVLRFWLLYFKLEWALSNINNQWQSIINSRIESQDWFLRNKKTYGSYTYLIKKVLIFTTILAVLNLWKVSVLYTIELEANKEWNDQLGKVKLPFDLIMGAIIYLPAMSVMLYIICKLPTFDDYLLIREEAKFSIYVFAFMTTMNLIAGILDEQSEDGKEASSWFKKICYVELSAFYICISQKTDTNPNTNKPNHMQHITKWMKLFILWFIQSIYWVFLL